MEGVLGDRKEVTGDDLDKMKYTEQVWTSPHPPTLTPFFKKVIQEVLRLYPIALPSLSKDSPKGGIVMSGYHIPEGTIIEVSCHQCMVNMVYDEGKRKRIAVPTLMGPITPMVDWLCGHGC